MFFSFVSLHHLVTREYLHAFATLCHSAIPLFVFFFGWYYISFYLKEVLNQPSFASNKCHSKSNVNALLRNFSVHISTL